MEEILRAWEDFARASPPAMSMDIPALRDHAAEMLEVIASDLERPQSTRAEVAKAHGQSDASPRAVTTPAQQHGAGRADSGFTVGEMLSEFRALRASVIRLWVAQPGLPKAEHWADITRFNEAIDQAIAESVGQYTSDVDRAKERFLAILGHDLITPLGAITTAARFMVSTEDLPEPHLTLVQRIESSAARMHRLIADLLDFTRTRFGEGIPVVRAPIDVRKLIHDVVVEIAAAHEDRAIQTESSGDLRGEWDRDRLAQMLSNLIGNAVQHGSTEAPIRVVGRGLTREVVISVHNEGPPISAARSSELFLPMKERRDEAREKDPRHLGLGLYIVDKIAKAHGGTIEVDSSKERGTTFTVHLPRSREARRGGTEEDAKAREGDREGDREPMVGR